MTSGSPATGDVFGQLATVRVIPVVVLDDSAAAAPLAGALADAGLPCAEITLRTAAGEAAIAIMAQQRNLLVGAGTVLDASQAEHAAQAGARFIVSPGFDEEVVRRCQELSVPVLPGAATATEIQRARRAGLRVIKFFPAETLGGVNALDALSAPFPDMRFIPTGGIGPGNVQAYLARSVVLAVGGAGWSLASSSPTGTGRRSPGSPGMRHGWPPRAPRVPAPLATGGPGERTQPAPRGRSQAS
jgi:2-dehydro-3-deoxyphosphogluconate aldolase / (4S)-4-hydroxy-2-oxoglutarate aldolase